MIDKSWAAPIGSIAFSTAANNRLRLFHSRSARACVGDEISALSRGLLPRLHPDA